MLPHPPQPSDLSRSASGLARSAPSVASPSPQTFPLRALGTLDSVFGTRNGTPRQPLLAPAARSRLTLRADLPASLLEGVAQYSHVWLVYVFHANTNIHRLWEGGAAPRVKGKVRVPRLDGASLGVLATRSPHRPCPLGLSVARVEAVRGRTLYLRGADVLDGTPVLDVKPYLPFCDALPAASAPAWAANPADAEGEPLALAGGVELGPQALEILRAAWVQRETRRPPPLCESAEAFGELLRQVLARDIRSVTQRLKAPARARALGGADALGLAAAEGQAPGGRPGKWHVVLDGLDVTYDVDEQRRAVVVRDARLWERSGG
ncbi:UPF0066 hypothetical protein [Helicosporidium sp. ATCC 50920]|nr:UPF0066 hypothetical protein [Helicosporidium sp. ATCC 50920]|eukprot:KDD73803.1 UPF0066 hypothetical protein [Helicosporidium sp. ATCC 50920]